MWQGRGRPAARPPPRHPRPPRRCPGHCCDGTGRRGYRQGPEPAPTTPTHTVPAATHAVKKHFKLERLTKLMAQKTAIGQHPLNMSALSFHLTSLRSQPSRSSLWPRDASSLGRSCNRSTLARIFRLAPTVTPSPASCSSVRESSSG